MIKILHAADLHLDSPFQGREEAQAAYLRQELLALPGKLAAVCRREGCDLMLLAGDVFDGAYTKESLDALRGAMAEAAVPVFITPGNHDFCSPASPWETESWPENVHIFTRPLLESIPLPGLDCRVYGAGYTSMDCPALLEGFRAECTETYAVGVLHGDAVQSASPYCPITDAQVRESGLDYLALGHIHKGDSIRVGNTLCAWPGCPMGRGFDELGQKGVLVVTLDSTATAEFIPLDGVKFLEYQVEAGTDPEAAVYTCLPPVGNSDFIRLTITGECPGLALPALCDRFPNLEVRDRTVPPIDLWAALGDDTLEGVYFRLLKEAMAEEDAAGQARVALAARISRQILDGQEVKLP